MPSKIYPRTMLALLTAINFFNYIDRSVLFAVQPLVQAEFRRSDAEFGFLTTAFFVCYMVAAPIIAFFADRYPRKLIVVTGIVLWSGATLLTAITHDFSTLFIRHALVGIGEASYAAIAPALIADLFPEDRRGRMLAIFYIAIPTGTAMGYMLGGYLGHLYGWRMPFYVAAVPGFILAAGLMFLGEPRRGANDHLRETPERATLLGLVHNPAFWTATLGMAMMTFALGGASVWIPTFLSRVRGVPLQRANLFFGASTAFNGIVATLIGGWFGDRLLRRTDSAYYFISGIGMMLALPAMWIAIYVHGRTMFVGIVIAEFFLFLSTGPLNAALVDAVAAPIRASAIAVNLIVIHLLGDAFSPVLMGYISDHRNLQAAFLAPIVAIFISGGILFYGMRFAPSLRPQGPGMNPIGAES
jgi:MFS transporter, Spinster family, sphingosine-1-phosphate transporter